MLMLSILSYVLIFFGTSLALTLGGYVPTAVFALIFIRSENKPGIVGLPIGIVGGVSGVMFGYLVFRLLVGEHAFGVFPILATLAMLLNCTRNDFRSYQDLARAAEPMDEEMKRMANVDSTVKFSLFAAWGQLVGAIGASILFLVRHLGQ